MQSRELVKLYYRIGEVSEIVGVQPHVLRYWETEFRSIRPQKSSKGQRVYSRRDVEKLLRVKDLLRNQGFTIAGARKRLSDAAEPAASAGPAAASPAVGPHSAGAHAGGPHANVASAPQLVASVAPPAANGNESAVELSAQRHPEPVTADRSAKDMRRALLGLRQDLMRMLDQLSARASDSQ
ncbi:MAG TPA: MerR family transcriptional regulator [Polyangiaceae bacterium]|jgi:DNA-binding transcriptional MerR regulator|nr:MerR family transcriptional regulator [Polyangiaceae bacterium]